MTAVYDRAKEIASKLIELEATRKSAQTQQKGLKEELLALISENEIDSVFETNDGMCYLDEKTNYKISDGLTEETKVTSRSPEKLSPDFIESYFEAGLKLSKRAKQAIKQDDTDLLAVLVPETKQSIKIVVREV